jgi:hypothetical protein
MKIFLVFLFCCTSFLLAQENIPKAELIDTIRWKAHDFYIGGGAGNICYTLEFGYLVGGNVFGNKATFWGFAFSDRYEAKPDIDIGKFQGNVPSYFVKRDDYVTESSIYTTFFDFKFNSGFGFTLGIDFSKKKEYEKYISTVTGYDWYKLKSEGLSVGPLVGIGYVFPKSKIGMKLLAGNVRIFSLIIDFGI